MGAEAETDQLQLVLDDPINENKVGFNMAVAVAGEFPFERMIGKLRQWQSTTESTMWFCRNGNFS